MEGLRSQITALELQIEAARARAERLRERAGHGLGPEASAASSAPGETTASRPTSAGADTTLLSERLLVHHAPQCLWAGSGPQALCNAHRVCVPKSCAQAWLGCMPAGKPDRTAHSSISSTATPASKQPVTLEQLAAKVAEAYVRCGFDADASMSPLLMLANMETRVDQQLAMIEALPADFVEGAEKAREKARRQVGCRG